MCVVFLNLTADAQRLDIRPPDATAVVTPERTAGR
jgi:hypothetical protein